MNKRRWIDSMVITVPGRENNDGTTTPAVDFRCEVETITSGAKRVRSAVQVKKIRRAQ